MSKKDTKNRIRTKPTLNFPKWLTIVASSVGVFSTLTLFGVVTVPLIASSIKKTISSTSVDFECEDEYGNFILPIQEDFVSIKIRKSHCLGGKISSGTISIFKKDLFYKTSSAKVKESKYDGFYTVEIKTGSYNEGNDIYTLNAENSLFFTSMDQSDSENHIAEIRDLIETTKNEPTRPSQILETEEISSEESYYFVFPNETDYDFKNLSQYLYVTSNLTNFYYCSDFSHGNSNENSYYGKTKISDIREITVPVLIRAYNGKFVNQYSTIRPIIKFLEMEYEVK